MCAGGCEQGGGGTLLPFCLLLQEVVGIDLSVRVIEVANKMKVGAALRCAAGIRGWGLHVQGWGVKGF